MCAQGAIMCAQGATICAKRASMIAKDAIMCADRTRSKCHEGPKALLSFLYKIS